MRSSEVDLVNENTMVNKINTMLWDILVIYVLYEKYRNQLSPEKSYLVLSIGLLLRIR